MNLYESLKSSLKESGSILDPAFTVCYNRLSIFPTRKSAIDFYKECMYGSEGSERERYTNIYLDLLDGSDVGLDDIDGDDTVWEIRWEDETGRNVAAQKLDGHKSANEIIKKIKSGKIMPPKEFLDIIDADTPKINESAVGGIDENYHDDLERGIVCEIKYVVDDMIENVGNKEYAEWLSNLTEDDFYIIAERVLWDDNFSQYMNDTIAEYIRKYTADKD